MVAPTEETIGMSEICGYCGKKGNGKSASPAIRRKSCTAYNHTCSHCGRQNYFDNVYRTKDRDRITIKDKFTSSECEGAVFDALCTITLFTHYQSTISIILEYYLYNQLCDAWEKQASDPQPFINVIIRILPGDFKTFGFNLPTHPKSVTHKALADTGCYSCLAGVKLVYRLGLKLCDLIPVTMQMHAANNNGIKILGRLELHFSGITGDGKRLKTCQIMHITDTSNKLFLSKEACITLGMISPNSQL